MIDGVKQGTFDAAVANISVTSERESFLDFSQPIYDSGLILAVNKNLSETSILKTIWESGIVKAIAWAFVVLIFVAHLMWAFE